ncbi:acyltransferase family protein [Nocardioides ferulae]|uniref:acyltransferase family protein n=1 Tax=Nocardioides ferulae TaxID=2340821 RepID=UPI000EB3FE90|nr:acyltransferase family protein [Nocardioides ferulae]
MPHVITPATPPASPAAPAAASRAEARPARPTRDPWFDNAKMALVLLVVVGHAWTLLPQTELNARLYDFLYAWHMPAFLVVTGYLSRSFTWERTRLVRLVSTVAVPYVLFEAAMAVFRVHVGGEELDDLWRDPHWPMWFLAALFFWRLLTPVFRPLRGGLPLAVAVSLAGGLWATDTLDLARVMGFLPFFVLGLKMTPERWERLRRPAAKAAGVVVLLAVWALSAHTDRWAATEWLYYRARYDELAASDTEAFLIRAVLLAVGVAGALAFLALVPRRGGWFARMGAWTLVVYLFHGFAVKGALYAGYADLAARFPVGSLVLTSVLGAGLALLLAWRPVATRLEPLVDPVGAVQRRLEHAHALREAAIEAEVLADAVDQATSAREPAPAGQ